MRTDEDVIQLARDRASQWFPAFELERVEVIRIHRKRHSTVHELSLLGSPEPVRVFVKEPRSRDDDSEPVRPRAVTELPVGQKASLQADALSDLADAVEHRRDPMIGTVRVLDCIDDRLVVLSAAGGRPLRDLVIDHAWWHRMRPRADLGPVFSRAGVILRAFHTDVVRPDAAEALCRRDDVHDAVSRFLDHQRSTSRSRRLDDIERRLRTQIDRHLPDRSPAATHFGDFGLTNLLVTDAGRVTAIDTLAALRTPPLHDATYLMSGLRSVRPQVLSLGHAISPRSLEAWERAFWTAYHGDDEWPVGAMAVWTAFRLLERWVAKTSRTTSRWARVGPGALVDRSLSDLVLDALTDAEASDARPGSVGTDDGS